ncbi:MAG TPA: hypothetical protein VNT01_09205 [Symbiobacteriaceae bacterium]|nr:hypothetical protein [Symbiobacteriaceae bacterium]
MERLNHTHLTARELELLEQNLMDELEERVEMGVCGINGCGVDACGANGCGWN